MEVRAMKNIFVSLLLGSLSFTNIFAGDDALNKKYKTDALSLADRIDAAKKDSVSRFIFDLGKRRNIKKLCNEAQQLIETVLENPAIDDAAELDILEPLGNAYIQLLVEITSRYDNPNQLELMENARRRGASFSSETNSMLDRYSSSRRSPRAYSSAGSSSQLPPFVQKFLNKAGAFGSGVLRDLSSLTGIAHQRDDGKRKIIQFPPPATPFIGEDANIGRMGSYMISRLQKAIANELSAAKKEGRDPKRVVEFFQSLAKQMVAVEPVKYRKLNLTAMIGATIIFQTLAWFGVDAGVIFWGWTEAGAWSSFVFLWQPLNILIVNTRRLNSGMGVARRARSLFKAVGLDPNTCEASLSGAVKAAR